MDDDRNDAPISGSTQQLVADLATLVRHEFDEAAQELAGKIKSAGLGVGMVSASALAGMMTVVCLTALAAILVCAIIPLWAAVLTVTLAWAMAALILAWLGKKKVRSARPFFPEQTIEHLKDDFAFARKRRGQPRP